MMLSSGFVRASLENDRGVPLAEAKKVSVEEVDQWTVAGQLHNLRPMYKYTWPDGQQVYVNGVNGEVLYVDIYGNLSEPSSILGNQSDSYLPAPMPTPAPISRSFVSAPIPDYRSSAHMLGRPPSTGTAKPPSQRTSSIASG